MFLTRKEIRDIKRAKRTEVNSSPNKEKMIIVIPNNNSIENAYNLIHFVLNRQLESPKNIEICVIGKITDKELNFIDENKSVFRNVNILNCNNIYKNIARIIKEYVNVKKVLWLNPNIVISPKFIQTMRNVENGTVIRPIHWQIDENKYFATWDSVLEKIESLSGIDGVYAFVMNRSDFLKIADIFDTDKINWCKFLYRLKEEKIKNLYFDMRILVKKNNNFFNLEEY